MDIDKVISASTKKRVKDALLVIIVLLSSVHAMSCVIFNERMYHTRYSPHSLYAGTADKPFVYRQLVPFMARRLVAFMNPESNIDNRDDAERGWEIPERKPSFLEDFIESNPHNSFSRNEFIAANMYPLMVMFTIDYLFLLGYLFCLWKLAKALFPDLPQAPVVAVLISSFLLPSFCSWFSYVYDFPVLFFSTAMTWLLYRQQWLLFSLGIALVTANKETSVYLIALYALYALPYLKRNPYFAYLSIQIALYAAVKVCLYIYYANNGGPLLMEWHLRRQIVYFLDDVNPFAALTMLLTMLFTFYDWKHKPYILKCWTVLIPPFFFAYMLAGNTKEYRIFYDILPAAILMLSHSFARLSQRADKA